MNRKESPVTKLRIFLSVICAALMVFFCGPIFAQAGIDTGGVTGTVKDPSGALVPGAQLTLTNVSTGVVQETVSTSAGAYAFQFVQVGQYSLKVAIMDAGYSYDQMGAGSLIESTVHGETLVTTGGASYRALVLPPLNAIDAALAEKLQSFAAVGLPILFAGKVPSRATGLFESVNDTQRVPNAMHNLRSYHHVYFSTVTEEPIATLRKTIIPNVTFHGPALPFIQKRIGRMNAFFLRNESVSTQHLNAEFEAEGKPELWDPWSGKTAAIAAYRRKGNRVQVEIDIQPFFSALIVLDREGGGAVNVMAANFAQKFKREEPVCAGGGKLTATGLMPSGETAEIRRDLPMLIDWSLDSELRGFSVRAVYRITFDVSATDVGNRLVLDLGNVLDFAEVTVNGKHAATLLLRPYQADITSLVQPGEKTLEIAVTNTLFNSMVLREPRTFRPGPTENRSGLMSGGLIGPVQVKEMD
jgi:alpha-L-rhamnosidase/Carboxypeptidase regulatory-like domain